MLFRSIAAVTAFATLAHAGQPITTLAYETCIPRTVQVTVTVTVDPVTGAKAGQSQPEVATKNKAAAEYDYLKSYGPNAPAYSKGSYGADAPVYSKGNYGYGGGHDDDDAYAVTTGAYGNHGYAKASTSIAASPKHGYGGYQDGGRPSASASEKKPSGSYDDDEYDGAWDNEEDCEDEDGSASSGYTKSSKPYSGAGYRAASTTSASISKGYVHGSASKSADPIASSSSGNAGGLSRSSAGAGHDPSVAPSHGAFSSIRGSWNSSTSARLDSASTSKTSLSLSKDELSTSSIFPSSSASLSSSDKSSTVSAISSTSSSSLAASTSSIASISESSASSTSSTISSDSSSSSPSSSTISSDSSSSSITSFTSSEVSSTTSSAFSSSSSAVCVPDGGTTCLTNDNCCNSASGSTCVAGTCQPCLPQVANYVQNGGFVNGFAPWTLSNVVGAVIAPAPNNAAGQEQDGDGWHIDSLLSGTAEWSVVQTNVNIPSGTTVVCSAYAFDTGGGVRADTVIIDGLQCGSTGTGSAFNWGQFGNGQLVVAGDSHTVVVRMSAIVSGSPNRIRLDNVQVGAFLPPPGRQFCSV